MIGIFPRSALKSSSHRTQAAAPALLDLQAPALTGSGPGSVEGNEGYPLSAKPTEEQPRSLRSPKLSPITQVFDQFGEASFKKKESRDLPKHSMERFRYEVFTPKMAQTV